MPEFAFANIPEQLVGTEISINQPICLTRQKSSIVKIKDNFVPHYECLPYNLSYHLV